MAQLAEASGLGPEGWGFDSLQRHQSKGFHSPFKITEWMVPRKVDPSKSQNCFFIMKIYANGCSCVWGQELIDNNMDNIENTKLSFPARLGAYNDAYPASSNSAISNRTLNYCRNNSVDIAIIGWTEYTRNVFFSQYSLRKDRLNQSTFHHRERDIFEKYFCNEKMLIMQSRNIIESTYAWLKTKNIRPIFFNSFCYIKTDVPMLWEGETWLNQYAKEHHLPIPKVRHPNQQEHNWLADYILKIV